uniref:Uncharacterized protein n=1 Tax=Chaetoceros debilis TaxID=122233 RepID=A0A7S3Q8M5_9STRA
MLRIRWNIIYLQLVLVPTVAAFITSPSKRTAIFPSARETEMRAGPISRLRMSKDDSEQLTSALARIDKEFQLTVRSSKRPTGGLAGWTKLFLDPSESESGEAENGNGNENEEFVYLLEPPSNPSIVISFIGGAGLGQFPHIAYSEFLSRISKRLNAAIIAAPYPVSLNHFELSKMTGEALRRGLIQCENNAGFAYPQSLPHFFLSHSLGGKLLAIALAASGVRDLAGIGLMSYNNFGFKDTLSMVKSFADDFDNGDGDGDGNGFGAQAGFGGQPQSAMFDQVLEFAGQTVDMLGFEFTPSPEDMDRIVNMKYGTDLQKKTRLFVFDEDNLDSSDGFLKATDNGPSVSSLRGKHLSPVFIKLGVDDLDIPDEYRQFASDATNGFQSASFGDEEAMNLAVDAVYDWILGKDPPSPAMLSGDEISA